MTNLELHICLAVWIVCQTTLMITIAVIEWREKKC